ncbi:Putative 115 kDa protein in type-1 retrotransposable element R1DM [Eumeta japonica]|uniref:115 kDa protein in type-1 retrotransposable element R1DM n=1 Tax=Eumeta variegata TaxID=151549 RepID=A0A4C1SC79_EUMVA|nr:Putative 115 kDa protein in type-1 retrotransposable element R1DM [Eumeta japonica]
MVMGYLRDREVVVRYAGESRRMTSKGCIQGSIAGPTFGISSLTPYSANSGTSVYTSGVRGRRGPDVFRTVSLSTGGGDQQGTSRCEGLGLSKQVEVCTIENQRDGAHQKTEIRCPGVQRAANIYKGIARAAKATWGLSPEIVRTIYVAAIEPIVMYASCAWAPATKKLGVRKMLDALQRSVALKACRAYRTVSLHSALILARLLPLDIRVREAARLYEVKRGSELGNVCADRELERPVYFREMPHPAHTPEFGFESVEDLDPSTVDRLAIVGPHIFTDGCKIEGKVVAALTEWRDEMESGNSAFRLESFCTVFQAEMFALQGDKGVRKTRIGCAPRHQGYRCGRQEVRLFWVRARTQGTTNERADELARNAALKGKRQRITIAFRCRTPKVIRAASLDEWQRYTEALRKLTGHGGFAQYLNRFKLKDSPYCACAPDKVQDVLHVLEECPIFGRERAETEAGTGVVVARHSFPALLDDQTNRKTFLKFCERVTQRCNKMNGSNIAYE